MTKRLKTSKVLGKFMADYYHKLDDAAKTKTKKIAWCTSVGPAELLRALGYMVYFPETHSAMLGTSRMATDLIPKANAIGYSPEVCSYLTTDIGAHLEGVSPLKKAFNIESPPKPDVLVFNTNQCRDVQDWFFWYGRKYKVPAIGIHTYCAVSDVTDDYIPSIVNQIKSLIKPLEEIAQTKFDIDKLKHIISLSKKCSKLWEKALHAGSAKPSPLNFFDAVTLMGAAVVGRGTEKANECYEELLKELNERIDKKEGAIEDEKYRLYWDGMPVWGRLRAHSEMFASLKACMIASTYCNSWIFNSLDPDYPFESMARAYTELFIARSEEYKEKYIKKMLKFFKADGIVYHDAKTCLNNSNCRYGMPNRLESETDIPYLIINGDLNDLRLISDEQTTTNVEAFIEQLEENIK